jgi:adenosylhomocysteine nucleosidase
MGAGAISQHAGASLSVIGLVAALPLEVECLAGRLEPGASATLSGNGRLRLSGLGSHNARRAAVELADSGVTALLSWGSAGGLDPGLTPGTLLLPRYVFTSEGRRFEVTVAWRAKLHELVSRQFETNTGALVQSSHPLTTAQQKRALFARTGAVAVDTESAAIAEVAASRGLSFVAIRAVLDPATRALPSSAVAAVDSSGRLLVKELVRGLVRRPSDLPGVLRLWSDLRLACATLAAVARLAGLRRGLRDPGMGPQ